MRKLLCLMVPWLLSAPAAEPERIIAGWLAHQTNVQSWAADFTQTRTLKTLVQPLVSTGQVWFAAPQNFRWQLGRDQTIAIRSNETMLVIYPRLKRAEKYDFENGGPNQWKDTLALLQSGFPRSRADLEKQFEILSAGERNDIVELALQPKSPAARRIMPRIHVLLTSRLTLAGTELVFVDGSRMRNDFHNVRTNADTRDKFNLAVPPDFKLIEPLNSNRK